MKKQESHNSMSSNGKKEGILNIIKSLDARKYTMVIALLVIWGIFSLLTDGLFTSSRNLSNLFLQMCYIGILASGMVFIMAHRQYRYLGRLSCRIARRSGCRVDDQRESSAGMGNIDNGFLPEY